MPLNAQTMVARRDPGTLGRARIRALPDSIHADLVVAASVRGDARALPGAAGHTRAP
jgi:hypothetical protein